MKKLDKYADKRIERLIFGLEKYHEFQELDSLHRIRVEIKKLRAIIQTLGFANRKVDAKKMFRPLRRIFRKAGGIRHSAVMSEMMDSYGIDGALQEQLGSPTRAENRFRARVPFYIDKVRKLRKHLPGLMRKVTTKDIAGFISKREKSIVRIFVPRLKPAQLHNARKRIKQIFYMAGLVDSIDKRDRKMYARLDEAIGSLHDKEVLLEMLASLPKATDPDKVRMLQKACAADRKSIAGMAAKFFK